MAKDEDKILALALRQARERVSETQEEFGARIGVDQATISRWEDKGPRTGGARSLVRLLLAGKRINFIPRAKSVRQ